MTQHILDDAPIGFRPAFNTNPCPRCGKADLLFDNNCGCCILCIRCRYKYPKQRVAK